MSATATAPQMSCTEKEHVFGADSLTCACGTTQRLAIAPAREAVNHPSHYHKGSGIEVIDALEAWGLGFSLGNAVKYIARAAHKDQATHAQDLKKARWYLERAIANVEQGKAP